MKISTKLYAGFTIMVVLTATLGIYISYVYGKSLTEDAGRQAVFNSGEIIKSIDRIIHDKIMEVGAATRRGWVISTVTESNAWFEQLENIDGYSVEIESQWAADPDVRVNKLQQELMSNSLANELREEFITFYESMHGFRVLNSLFVTNKYGASIAQTDKIDHFLHDKETWWQKTKQQGGYIGKVEYNKMTKNYGIPASFSIADTKGNFLGVLKIIIDIKNQIRIAELSSRDLQTSQITIFTDDGKIIYRTKPYRFMEDFSSWQYFTRLQVEDNYFIGVSKGGKQKLYSYTRSKGYKHYPGFNWILMLENDLGVIMAPANALGNHTALVSVLLVFLGSVTAFLIARSVTKPIRALIISTRIIGDGNLGHRVDLKTKDEMGEMAHAFNEMAEKRQLIEDDLRVSSAQLKAANKELEAFSYSVSHDLRAPLRAIDGFARILLEDHAERLDKEGSRVLNVIGKNVQKMGQLIDDLLAFSRLDRKKIKTSHVDMNQLTKELIEELKADLGERMVNFNIKPLPDSIGDRAMLREVLLNLISNALKFTGKKNPAKIEIHGNIEADENVYYIRDNGAGFNMKYAGKLFKVFQRLHSSTEFKGTGIGLALSRRIIKKHGGRMWAKGAVNKGATFYFSLPKKGENNE